MTDKTTAPAGVVSSTELGSALDAARLALPEFSQQDDYLLAHGASLMSEDSHEILHRDTLRRIVAAAVVAERERWQQVAKSVIESHDAALAYVYERLRSQGVGSITIPDSAVAEIRAVNALRELVQPNEKDQPT